MITHKQLTLAEIFEDCQNKFNNDKYGIAQLVTVIVADKIHQHQYIRSLKTLIA